MPHTIRILIADDHPIFRDGLHRLIESQPGFSLAGEAIDGQQALTFTQKLKPDILLLDLAMPKLPGLEVLKQLAAMNLHTRTIILSAAVDQAQMTEALQFGARGVVLKDTASQLLVKSMQCVMNGEYWVGRSSVEGLVQALRSANENRAEEPAKRLGLTAREIEMVSAIVDGYTNKEIAHRFSISEQTVKHHLSRIFDKVGVSNRLELALYSLNHGLVGKSQ